MGCSPSTVKVHLHRARGRLADALALDREEVADE
jgi:DNA-directed RNA polymerase specialized sigma24 family protein